MDFRHYTDRTAQLAVDLANAFPDPFDRTVPPTVEELRGLLDGYELRSDLAPGDVERLGDLALALRGIFAARDASTAAQLLNALLERTRAVPWISEHGGADPHLHFGPQQADIVDRVAASTAMSLAVVLCDYGIERLGQCAAADCVDVFIDTSRSAKRRYCSTGCSNRSNVREHRARARDAVG